MGMNTAIKNFQILDNAYGVLGIELMAAAQALASAGPLMVPRRTARWITINLRSTSSTNAGSVLR